MGDGDEFQVTSSEPASSLFAAISLTAVLMDNSPLRTLSKLSGSFFLMDAACSTVLVPTPIALAAASVDLPQRTSFTSPPFGAYLRAFPKMM